MMYWTSDWNNLGTFGMMGGIMMLIFWVIIIIIFLWLISWIVGQNRHNSLFCCGDHNHNHDTDEKNGNALEILKERYAKGEIDKKEFEEKKKDLYK